jgi:hypothetical protein
MVVMISSPEPLTTAVYMRMLGWVPVTFRVNGGNQDSNTVVKFRTVAVTSGGAARRPAGYRFLDRGVTVCVWGGGGGGGDLCTCMQELHLCMQIHSNCTVCFVQGFI